MVVRFKPYEYTARTFLTLVIIGTILGFICGAPGGLAYGLYRVIRLIVFLTFGSIVVTIIVFAVAARSKQGA